MPSRRCNMTMMNDRAMSWVAVRVMTLVARMPHDRMGMRNSDMPGARMVRMVVRMLTAPVMDEMPKKKTDAKYICMPRGAWALRGG